jgi:acyl-CoA thioesterase YciA
MGTMAIIDRPPKPTGKLALQTIAMPKDTNANGDIFGGWLVSQMDLAGGVTASRLAKGRVATVAIDRMNFMQPVKVGAIVSCYSEVIAIGRSSMELNIEVWASYADENDVTKVTDGNFIYVAIDNNGRTRSINQQAAPKQK